MLSVVVPRASLPAGRSGGEVGVAREHKDVSESITAKLPYAGPAAAAFRGQYTHLRSSPARRVAPSLVVVQGEASPRITVIA